MTRVTPSSSLTTLHNLCNSHPTVELVVDLLKDARVRRDLLIALALVLAALVATVFLFTTGSAVSGLLAAGGAAATSATTLYVSRRRHSGRVKARGGR